MDLWTAAVPEAHAAIEEAKRTIAQLREELLGLREMLSDMRRRASSPETPGSSPEIVTSPPETATSSPEPAPISPEIAEIPPKIEPASPEPEVASPETEIPSPEPEPASPPPPPPPPPLAKAMLVLRVKPSMAAGVRARPSASRNCGTVTPTAANETGDVACGADAPPEAGKPKPQFAGPPPMTIDEQAAYRATVVTSCGTIVIDLDAKRAPQTVNSFVFLAERGYFDGQYFHRLDTSIDVIQGGDPTGTGSGGPGYAIPDELNGKLTYTAGTIAMANAGANTGGSQFFIITGPEGSNLDANPNYTIFGKVVEGLPIDAFSQERINLTLKELQEEQDGVKHLL